MNRETIVNLGQNAARLGVFASTFLPIGGPILAAISAVAIEILNLTEVAEHNKRICRNLSERVQTANQLLQNKVLTAEKDNVALLNYRKALERCRDFIKTISKASTLIRIVTAREIERDFNDVTRDLDLAVGELGLQQIVRTREQVRRDNAMLRDEVKESLQVIEKALANIFDAQMSVQTKMDVLDAKLETIRSAMTHIDDAHVMPPNIESTRISSAHVTDVLENGLPVVRGNGMIRKKMFIAQTVAEKTLGYLRSMSRTLSTIEKQVAILTELRDCQYIVRFYGTLQRDDCLCLIMEWTESGDLYTYLHQTPNLSWDFKIRVATEIASGLVFCHTFDILHHDIRSHNILLTAELTAKIGNFESARKDAEDSILQIPDLNLRYRWLAPEKLKDYANTKYNKQCEIYSFAIVLWELASQQLPYNDIESTTILTDRVTAGYRPPYIPDTPEVYQQIMELGWCDYELKRPTAASMFNALSHLKPSNGDIPSNSFFNLYASISTPPTPTTEEGTSEYDARSRSPSKGGQNAQKAVADLAQPPQECDIMSEPDSTQVGISIMKRSHKPPSISEALSLHRQKLYAQAWPMFEVLAEQEDALAEFYVGYYLYSGKHTVRYDPERAVEYFKRAATRGIPDAQFRYAVALLEGVGIEQTPETNRIGVEYLIKAARNGNSNAMYNYGELLINGLHVAMDLAEGEKWMRMAHDRGHPSAYRTLADRLEELGQAVPEDVSENLNKSVNSSF